MSISYIASLEELAVLTHFSGLEEIPGFLKLPDIDQKQCGILLDNLDKKGLIRRNGNEFSVDLVFNFILQTIAMPDLAIKTANGVLAYCAEELGVIVNRDSYSKKYRLTPLPDAAELALHLWSIGAIYSERYIFAIYRKAAGWTDAELGQADIFTEISRVYRDKRGDDI